MSSVRPEGQLFDALAAAGLCAYHATERGELHDRDCRSCCGGARAAAC